MNADPSGKHKSADSFDNQHVDAKTSEVRLDSADVPTFGCIVYVSTAADGGVRARVANLPGFEYTAGSEREAFAKIVPAFKQRLAELIQDGNPIPWIDPPMSPQPDEHERFIPVHL